MKKKPKLNPIVEAILCLIDTSRHAVSSLEIDTIIGHVKEILPRVFDVDGAYLRLVDSQNTRLLTIMSSHGIPEAGAERIKYLPIGVGIEGVSAKSRSRVNLRDIIPSSDIKYAKELKEMGMRSALCVPIVFDNDVYGTITLLSKTKSRFAESDVYLLYSFANVVGIALKNAYLYRNLKENYLNTINSLVLIMESRDSYMRGHSERVTSVAIEIARQMNLPESDQYVLRTAGKLHDIGKITISDRILSKPEKLTPSEWAEIHMHPIRGVEIVMPLRFLEGGLALIRNHHERFDGHGYPDGLARNSIPLLARILAVADAFDAMTSERPYRRPLKLEKAIDEIKTASGTQFDPAVTKAFLQIVGRIR